MTVDDANARFWDELCGTGFARSLGITELNHDSLARFDAAYFAYYPYLMQLLNGVHPTGKRILEIGLGFGTVSEFIGSIAKEFFAIDIAAAPVALVRQRLEFIGRPSQNVIIGSALALPYQDESFDVVVSIGALHHTGDLARAINEVWRVLRPNGQALVMVYNGQSFRRLAFLTRRAFRSITDRARVRDGADLRGMYDYRSDGSVAPHTDFVTRSEARRLFRRFASIRLEDRNFDDYVVARRVIPRTLFLRGVDRVLGLDLYVTARK